MLTAVNCYICQVLYNSTCCLNFTYFIDVKILHPIY